MDRYIFADRLERRRSRLLVLLILVLILAAMGVAAYQRDQGTGALLVVRRAAVEHQNDDRISPARGSSGVEVGDVIRTKRGGEAQVSYFDGSVTRVDSGTTFKVIDLVDTSDRRTIAGRLDSGRIWNSVEHYTGAGDRFEIRVPNAWITARGTANVIDCREAPGCEVIGIVSTTVIATDDGLTTLVTAGQCATIAADGTTGACDYPREQLCEDGFTREGLTDEGLEGQCGQTPATPTSTATPEPTHPPVGSPTPTPTPSATVSPSPTPEPSGSPSPSPTPSSQP